MKTKIKKGSLLQSDSTDYDYVDSYEYTIADPGNKIGIPEITAAFGKPGPKWFDGLFTLRNKIVSVFGLKTPSTAEKSPDSENNLEPGTQAGIFKVFALSDHEIILGEDDKHLDVRVSLFLEQNGDRGKKITVTTVVKLHNRLGKTYFFFIKPFHCTVVPAIMKRNIKRLESEVQT